MNHSLTVFLGAQKVFFFFSFFCWWRKHIKRNKKQKWKKIPTQSPTRSLTRTRTRCPTRGFKIPTRDWGEKEKDACYLKKSVGRLL